jgi:hypothetical protein
MTVAYVCRGRTCSAPITSGAEELERILRVKELPKEEIAAQK